MSDKLKIKNQTDSSTLHATAYLGMSAHPAVQSASVHTFFGHLWWTAGEAMPTK